MIADVERLLGLVHHVQSAWDQYTVQQRLPDGGPWLTQGHPWDAYNRGHAITPARRDPLAMSAAWNDVEETLRELSTVAERIRSARDAGGYEPAATGWQDRRMGPYTPAPSGAVSEVMAGAAHAA